MVKIDNAGYKQWEKTYGGTNEEVCFSVDQTSDWGYVLTGFTESFGAGDFDIYLIKIDYNGNLLWTKTYGNIGSDVGYSVQETFDGGLILTGNITMENGKPVNTVQKH